jgi:hypothetical protein
MKGEDHYTGFLMFILAYDSSPFQPSISRYEMVCVKGTIVDSLLTSISKKCR